MSEVRIRITVSSDTYEPSTDALRQAHRYREIAAQSVSVSQRRACLDEAERLERWGYR